MPHAVRSCRDLRVWQRCLELIGLCYCVTRSFPSHEMFGLTSQIRRAATSVAANIAEGHGRGRPKEFLHYLRTARGSLMELDTHVEIAMRLNYLSADHVHDVEIAVSDVGRMMAGLRRRLLTRLQQSPMDPSHVSRIRRTL
ncbi:MAG: four helix bundle protein [Gemmatimonadota bacterium]|nr:four helix bundle protein [Gemmatimonadota bacterium]